MNVDWSRVMERLGSYAPGVHNILRPCEQGRIEAVEQELGKLPEPLIAMLRHFNGAELFISALPLVTVFGISPIRTIPALEWAPDWYIDKLSVQWRSSHNRPRDWTIAMTNYGGLIVLGDDGMLREWDTGQAKWSPRKAGFAEWIEEILREGDAYLQG